MRAIRSDRKEVLERVANLRATGLTRQEITDTMNADGYTLRSGEAIKTSNVSGYLHTIKKRSNGSLGISRAEALAARNATIEKQIEALRVEQVEGTNDLPRVIVTKSGHEYECEMTADGGISFWNGGLELDHLETKNFVRWIKENF